MGQEKKVQAFKQIVHIPVLFVIKNEMLVLLLYLYLYLVLDATHFYCLPVIWIGCWNVGKSGKSSFTKVGNQFRWSAKWTSMWADRRWARRHWKLKRAAFRNISNEMTPQAHNLSFESAAILNLFLNAHLWNWYSRLNSCHHSDAFINDGLSLFAWLQELPILNNWDLIKFLLPRISPIRTCRGAERGRGTESDVAFLDFGFRGEIDV